MTVNETVAALIAQVRAGRQPVEGEWSDGDGFIGWADEDGADRIFITRRRAHGLHAAAEWASHPAVFLLEDDGRYAQAPEIAIAGWALEDGTLDAMLAAGVDAEYARAAHRAGVTDAWAIIEGWVAAIPVEYLAEVNG